MSENIEEITEEIEGPTEEQIAAQEEAKKYGWKPKEEFDLAPDGWVDAERFLELPSTDNKRLRDENRAFKEASEKSQSEFQSRIDRLEASNKEAVKRALEVQKQQYEDQQASLRQQQRDAAEIGDVETFDRIETQRATLKPPEPIAEPQHQEVHQDIVAYAKANEWTQDPLLWRMAADAVGSNPDILARSPAEQMAYGEKVVKDLFPHKFATPKPKRQMVDGGGFGASANQGKGASSLPPEAVKAGREFVEQGIFKSLEDYAKVYHEQG